MDEDLIEFTLWIVAVSIGVVLSTALIRVAQHITDALWRRITARVVEDSEPVEEDDE